jgi:hypothetical protein
MQPKENRFGEIIELPKVDHSRAFIVPTTPDYEVNFL